MKKALVLLVLLTGLAVMAGTGQGNATLEITVPTAAKPAEALAGAGAGLCDNGVHYFKVAYVTSTGVATTSAASDATTVADKSADGKILITRVTNAHAQITGINIYMTEAGGTDYYLAYANEANTNGDTTVNIADATLITQGAMPTVDTASAAGETSVTATAQNGFTWFTICDNDGTNPVYFTIDGSDVLAGGTSTFQIPADLCITIEAKSPGDDGKRFDTVNILAGSVASEASWVYVEDR